MRRRGVGGRRGVGEFAEMGTKEEEKARWTFVGFDVFFSGYLSR